MLQATTRQHHITPRISGVPNSPRFKGATQSHSKTGRGNACWRPAGDSSAAGQQEPWRFPRRSDPGHFSTDLSQRQDKTRLVLIIQSPKWGVQSGTARITRWSLGSRAGQGVGLRTQPSPASAAARRPRLRNPPAAPLVRAAITGSRRTFGQERMPRPFCWRRGPRPRRRGVDAPGSCSARPPPGRPLPAPPGLPAHRRRRARSASGAAVTRAALAPPRATSPAPRAGRARSAEQRGLGRRGARRRAGRRAEGGGGGHKAAFVPPRPARCGGRGASARPHRPHLRRH